MRETPKAARAWADYLAMGPGRSLEALLNRYRSETAPPTRRLASLKQWSSEYGWQRRLEEIVAREAREAEEQQAAYVRSVLESGFALHHERVRAMGELAGRLFAELTERGPAGRLWLRDVKSVGSGVGAERVDLERFNAEEVAQFRGLLDDIAKEVGQRVKKTEVTGKDGGPVQVAATWAQAIDQLWREGAPQ